MTFKAYSSYATSVDKIRAIAKVRKFMGKSLYAGLLHSTPTPQSLSKLAVISDLKLVGKYADREFGKFLQMVNQVLNCPFYISFLHLFMVMAISKGTSMYDVVKDLEKQRGKHDFCELSYMFPINLGDVFYGKLTKIFEFSYEKFRESLD